MNVRAARREDLPALLALEEEYTESDETLGALIDRFEKWPELFVVATDDGTIVGEASGIAKNDRVTLSAIAVRHWLQLRGIGRRLLELFESGAARYGRTVDVGAGEESEPFYLACGYRATSLLVRVRTCELPSDYRVRGYRVEGERERGEDTYLYVEDVYYAPDLKDTVRAAFRAAGVNYIFEKRLPEQGFLSHRSA